MSDIDEARRMIGIANRDLRALRGMTEAPDAFSEEVFGFQAQQAVEKALKSWLALVVGNYPYIHDLEELFARVREAGRTVPAPFVNLIDLVDFAVQYRYQAFEDEAGMDRGATAAAVAEFLAYVENLVSRAEQARDGPARNS
ncbi:MAG TPA: HEPN domain-containing protein [Planctomycetota bacterium]|nr:HEPN domain-containing protein [Planctomycetota bacterium]